MHVLSFVFTTTCRVSERERERESRDSTLWSTRIASCAQRWTSLLPSGSSHRTMSGEQEQPCRYLPVCLPLPGLLLLVTEKKRPPLLNRAAKLQPIKLTVHGNRPLTVDLSVITSLVSAPSISDPTRPLNFFLFFFDDTTVKFRERVLLEISSERVRGNDHSGAKKEEKKRRATRKDGRAIVRSCRRHASSETDADFPRHGIGNSRAWKLDRPCGGAAAGGSMPARSAGRVAAAGLRLQQAGVAGSRRVARGSLLIASPAAESPDWAGDS